MGHCTALRTMREQKEAPSSSFAKVRQKTEDDQGCSLPSTFGGCPRFKRPRQLREMSSSFPISDDGTAFPDIHIAAEDHFPRRGNAMVVLVYRALAGFTEHGARGKRRPRVLRRRPECSSSPIPSPNRTECCVSFVTRSWLRLLIDPKRRRWRRRLEGRSRSFHEYGRRRRRRRSLAFRPFYC